MKFVATVWLLVTLGSFGVARAAQVGIPRALLVADYSTKRIALVRADDTIEWQHPIRDLHDLSRLPNSNILFQTSWTRIVEMTPENRVAWSYDAAKQNRKTPGEPVEVHSFQRLENGRTLLAESGPGRLIEVDREGKIELEVPMTRTFPDVQHDTRLARKLNTGNYLVAHERDRVVREYDPSGTVVWEHYVGEAVYSAVRLTNGNTLIGCGSGGRVVEVDPAGKVVWGIDRKELPGIILVWVTLVERLPSGNTLVVNAHAGRENPQILEVTMDKRVVWTFSDWTRFGNALVAAEIISQAPALE